MSEHKGLTFIELSVSILIIAVLAKVALPVYEVTSRRALEWELKADLREIREAIDKYFDLHQSYPKTLEDLIQKDSQGKRYLRRIPEDPLTRKSEWFTISSSDDRDNFVRLFSDKTDVYDIRTTSDLKSLEGTQYNEW
ncbi:MAG: prepilin-type N-terminal cleavage/methylation domain-containing protein [Candidatus Wallbacteria bacterium]|nr:prepilin-type N-terminal cleavage/methylation domain-containing protein [Candidatus Wallbacteria bacterium]